MKLYFQPFQIKVKNKNEINHNNSNVDNSNYSKLKSSKSSFSSSSCSPSSLRLLRTLDVEETVWSSQFGMKGKLDVLVQTIMNNNSQSNNFYKLNNAIYQAILAVSNNPANLPINLPDTSTYDMYNYIYKAFLNF